MSRWAASVFVILGCLFLGAGVGAEPEVVSDESAADLAAFIADQASQAEIEDQPDEVADDELRARVDELASTAAELESRIRAGADKGATRDLYRKLRSERIAIIDLAMRGEVEIPALEAALFEQMLGELKTYYAE